MTPRVHLNDWDTLSTELRRFGQSGDVTLTDDRIRIDFGSACVEVTRDGALRTGMPLHDFVHDDTAVLAVDHDAGTLTVEADTVSYTFRRPGT
jgi:hypothetical protein